MSCFYSLHSKVEKLFGGTFEKYGRFISRNPWKAIIFVVVVDIGFGFGILNLTPETDIEQYAPTDSTAMKNREQARGMFTTDTSTNFYPQSLVEMGHYGVVIIQRKDGGNMVDSSIWPDLEALRDYVALTSIIQGGTTYNYTDICGKRFSACVIDGEYIFSSDFTTDLASSSVSYPMFTTSGQSYTIDGTFGGAVSSSGILTSARAIKLKFYLADTNKNRALDWEDAFLVRVKSYSSSTLQIEFAHSGSLDKELSANVSKDITFFSVTFTLMITFSCFVLMGGNCVSNRYNLGLAGILSTGLAIVASIGIVSVIGVKFSNIVGTMPFLIIGIGVDDMFILLSTMADTSSLDDVETRIGKTMRTSGIAITITSLTDVVAFCAGASSVFPAVRNFSWFTGTAILFCYLNYITFFLGCMTINERRVTQNKHFMTCRVTKSKEDMVKEGKSKCLILCCAGSPHQHRNEIEGPMEKYPKRVLKKIVLFLPAKIVILVLFAGFIAASIYGTANFQEGLIRKDLVASDSYYYTFYETDASLYDQTFPIGLYVQSGVDYMSSSTLDAINELRDTARNDTDIDDSFFISWLHAYMDSGNYDSSSTANFILGLQTYLGTTEGNLYINDVTIDGTTITASRFYVYTGFITTSTQEANMLKRLRDIVDDSTLPVFAYAPAFIFTEQFIAIYPQTMQTLGICVVVVFLITAIFLPLPIMILFITLTVILIMVGVIGFMHFWNLTLSSITLIHIIMCIGFCVDFATHICHAFVEADGTTKNVRVDQAIDRAGGPILNGALSTIIGVLMLVFSKSFIFFSFFKVMLMVMTFGLLYAVLLLPVLLSFFGPKYVHQDMKNTCVADTNAIPNEKGTLNMVEGKEFEKSEIQNFSKPGEFQDDVENK